MNYMKKNHREYALSVQLLHSGTSIGANIKKAIYAQSRNDFLARALEGAMSIFPMEGS